MSLARLSPDNGDHVRLSRMFDDGPERDTAFLYELARESATTELVAHLRRGETPLVRRRAAETLGDLSNDSTHEPEDEVIRALIRAVVEDDDDSVRARAIDALYRYEEGSFDRLVREITGFDAGDAPDWATARVLERWGRSGRRGRSQRSSRSHATTRKNSAERQSRNWASSGASNPSSTWT